MVLIIKLIFILISLIFPNDYVDYNKSQGNINFQNNKENNMLETMSNGNSKEDSSMQIEENSIDII